jgi:hypothetical protein
VRRLSSVLVFAGLFLLSGCASNQVVPTDLHARGKAVKRPRCRAERTLRRLSRKPEEKLDALDQATGSLTTPFKKVGVSGWKDTGCDAEGVGVAVREAQKSAKDFWTVDVELERLAVGSTTAPPGRFLRIEIWPGTHGSALLQRTKLGKGTRVAFGGPFLIDEDGPFLEVHPDEDFRILAAR